MNQIITTLPYAGFSETKPGGRSENQDYCWVEDTPVGLLAVVCDGMGGGPAGKLASSTAVKTIFESVKDVPAIREAEKVLRDAITAANSKLLELISENPELKGMGTTVVALLINKEVATIAHVGDSRLYQLRGRKKVFVTNDHSKVAEMVRAKVLTEEQARLSSMSNVITRALGIYEECEVEIDQVPYEKGDRFVLCTDGIWGAMPEKDLVGDFTSTKSLSGSVDRISVKVDAIGHNEGGKHDNHTIVLIETRTNSIEKVKMSKKVRLLVWALSLVCVVSILFNIIQYCSNTAEPVKTESNNSVNVENDTVDNSVSE